MERIEQRQQGCWNDFIDDKFRFRFEPVGNAHPSRNTDTSPAGLAEYQIVTRIAFQPGGYVQFAQLERADITEHSPAIFLQMG